MSKEMEYPCDTCKHVDICSLDSDDYQCSAVFIFRQLNKDSLRGMLTTIVLGYDTKKAYKNNLQYVRQQYKKVDKPFKNNSENLTSKQKAIIAGWLAFAVVLAIIAIIIEKISG